MTAPGDRTTAQTLLRSWDLVQKSFAVLLSVKQLLFLPLVSGMSCLIVSSIFISGAALVFRPQFAAMSTTNADRFRMTQGMCAALFLFYFVNYLVVILFNVALVSAASDHFADGKATLDHGLQVAWDRKGSIFQWAILAASVGLILNMIEDRRGWVGSLAARSIGVAWSTFFVIPLIAVEDIGPIEALSRSSNLFSETWGEERMG